MYTKSNFLALTLALATMLLAVQAADNETLLEEYGLDQNTETGNLSDQPLAAPSGLKAETKSSSAILLSWEEVHSSPSLPIQGYVIQYAPTEGGQKPNEIVENTTGHLFDRLMPNTSYTFYVTAYNSKGASELSEPVVQVTGEDGGEEENVTGTTSQIDRLKPLPEPVVEMTGEDVGSLNLSLGFSLLSPPLVIALGRDHPVLLNCSGYSEEGPLRISWRLEDADIEDEEHRILPNGSLLIDPPPSWDRSYMCELCNDVGALLSRPIHVILARMNTSFTFEPQPHTTFEGGQVRFSCQLDAVPPCTTTWYKNGIKLPRNDFKYENLPSGSLAIYGVTMYDVGSYKCQCSNVAGQKNSSEAILTVLPRTVQFIPPVFFNDSDAEVTAVAGEQLRLEAFADGFPDVAISWRREDGKNMSVNWNMYSYLHFQRLQQTDTGSYICSAKVTNNYMGKMGQATHKVFLTVNVPPTFTKVPMSQTVRASGTVQFDCEVESHPASAIYWLKDGERLDIKDRIELMRNNSILHVSRTVTSDSGIYQCVASNPAGVNTSAARLLVKVFLPPTFTKVPMSQTIQASRTVKFDCEVESHPPSTIYWVKDGERLDTKGRIKLMHNNSTLVVSHTVTSDSGIYQCVASNPAGVNTSAARLLVTVSRGQPQAPSGLKAETQSSGAILLSWEEVHSSPSLPTIAYNIHYVPTQGGQKPNELVVTTTSHLFDSLQPNTSYTFYVTAYNKKGASELSEPVVQVTGEDGHVHGMRK